MGRLSNGRMDKSITVKDKQVSLRADRIIGLSGRCTYEMRAGIATRYGLEGPGIDSRWRRDFLHLSRLAPEPTQPPIQWVPEPFRE